MQSKLYEGMQHTAAKLTSDVNNSAGHENVKIRL